MSSNIFVCQLSKTKQRKLENIVRNYLKEDYTVEEIEEIVGNVMNDRLCNLEEIIDLEEFLMEDKIINLKDYM